MALLMVTDTARAYLDYQISKGTLMAPPAAEELFLLEKLVQSPFQGGRAEDLRWRPCHDGRAAEQLSGKRKLE